MDELKKESGFTIMEIIMCLVVMGILAVVGATKFLDLQEEMAIEALKGAKMELDTREHLAWVKYGLGRLSWTDLQKEETVTGGSSGFGDYKVEGGELKAPGKFTMTVDVNRIVPTHGRPGRWLLGEFHP